LVAFHRDSFFSYRRPRYFPRYKALHFYKADLWGFFLKYSLGRWKFKRKAFRRKKFWLFSFSIKIAHKFLRNLNPEVLRNYKKKKKVTKRAIFTLFRLKKYLPALKEGALRYYVVSLAAKTRYLYDNFFSDFMFFLDSRLDAMLQKTGFFFSSFFVKQLIIHNKILVDFFPITYCNYLVPLGSFVSFKKEAIILFLQVWFKELPFFWFILRFFLGLFVYKKKPKIKPKINLFSFFSEKKNLLYLKKIKQIFFQKKKEKKKNKFSKFKNKRVFKY